MSSAIHRTPSSKPPERRSLFFRDLASPVSAHRSSRFAVSGQTAGGSALWRENFSTSDDPPPPPVFTLEDRVDFSPEPAIHEVPTSPETKTPTPTRNYFSTPSPIRTRVAAEGSGGVAAEKSVGSGGWWAPPAREEKGSPVDGVVTSSSALVVVPPASQRVPMRDGMLGEEEWVTVYGFSPGDTNLVLREFEKCGVILKHVPGPRDANWMHILYQNRYNAQKALAKNGAQLNSVLIIGVKPVDPSQRQYLNEKLSINSNGGFMGSLPSQSASKRSSTLSPVPLLKDGGGHRSTGAVASPVKSVVSRVMDLMFGL